MPALSCRAARESRFSGFARRRIWRLLVFGGEPVFGSTRVVFGSAAARCLAPSSPPEPTLGNGSLPETRQLKGAQAGYSREIRDQLQQIHKIQFATIFRLQIWLQAPVILPAI